MKIKDHFLIVNKYYIKLNIVNSGLTPFAIFMAVTSFHANKMFVLFFEVNLLPSKNCVDPATNNNQKIPILKNTVVLAVYTI